jgi:pyruvate ferredoxin oxidoreductase delta subunit
LNEEAKVAKPIDQYTWRDIPIGFVVDEPGNAREYKTGDWRLQRPVVYTAKCIKCAVCWLFCRDAVIYKNEAGYYLANLDYCKGCGICAREYWTGCITMVDKEK